MCVRFHSCQVVTKSHVAKSTFYVVQDTAETLAAVKAGKFSFETDKAMLALTYNKMDSTSLKTVKAIGGFFSGISDF